MPDYHRPETAIPLKWNQQEVSLQGTNVARSSAPYFNDEKLQQLIKLTIAGNKDLQVSALNLKKVGEQYGADRLSTLPNIGMTVEKTAAHEPAGIYDTVDTGRLQGMIDGIFEPDEDQLKMVMRQLNELNRLVEDLHLLKLADAGQLNLDVMPVNLSDIVREKIAWITPSAKKVGVDIIHHQKQTITCMADPYRIGQVFLILMDNALRYAADGGVLDISYRSSSEAVVVVFKDSGPAVADNFLDSIFTPFVREDVSRSRHSGGSGLGLSIARAICEAHGGRLSAEKNKEKGLSFCITLPRH